MKHLFIWLFAIIFLAACGNKTQEIHLQEKKLTAAVYASGSLVPEQEYKVISGVDGYLSQALVKEGDKVSKGQLLFVLSSEVRQAQEQGARAIVRQTLPIAADNAPSFRELRGQLEVARIKKHQDSLNYVRYKTLYDQNAISKLNYERYYLQYQTSSKDYQNIKQRLEQQELNVNLQLQQAENQLSLATAQTDYGRLRGFVNGTVYEVYKKEGDLVAPNQPIALIGEGNMIAKLLVDEDDLNKIYQNQKVLITMDAYPDKVFNAHITKIYPLLNKVEQSFRVDATFDDSLPVVMYGLNLEANIVIAEQKVVFVLPKQALLKGDSVVIKADGKNKKIKITKGIEDDQYVEVKAGVNKETVVIVEQ